MDAEVIILVHGTLLEKKVHLLALMGCMASQKQTFDHCVFIYALFNVQHAIRCF